MNDLKKHTLAFIFVMMFSAVLIIAGGLSGGLLIYTLVEAGTVIAAAVAAILTGRRPGETFALKIPRIRDFFAGLLVFVSALAMQNAAARLLLLLSDKFSAVDGDVYARYMSNSNPAAVLFVFAIMPAVCEELLFRGFAVTTAKKIMRSETVIIIFTAILFAAMHFNAYKFIYVFILGAAFGYIAVRSGSVIISMIMHVINNTLAIASLMLGSNSAVAAAEELPVYVYVPAAIAVSAVMFLIGRAVFNSGKANDK